MGEGLVIKERYYHIVLAALELVLGIFAILVAINIYRIAAAYGVMLGLAPLPPYTPPFVVDMLEGIHGTLLFGGIFILIHGIKRIIDNLMRPFVAK